MKILIATDGSDFSKAAIEKACEILAKGENNLIEIIKLCLITLSILYESVIF